MYLIPRLLPTALCTGVVTVLFGCVYLLIYPGLLRLERKSISQMFFMLTKYLKVSIIIHTTVLYMGAYLDSNLPKDPHKDMGLYEWLLRPSLCLPVWWSLTTCGSSHYRTLIQLKKKKTPLTPQLALFSGTDHTDHIHLPHVTGGHYLGQCRLWDVGSLRKVLWTSAAPFS